MFTLIQRDALVRLPGVPKHSDALPLSLTQQEASRSLFAPKRLIALHNKNYQQLWQIFIYHDFKLKTLKERKTSIIIVIQNLMEEEIKNEQECDLESQKNKGNKRKKSDEEIAESIKNAILITIVAIIVIALALGIIIGIPLLIGHRYNLSWWWIVLMIIGMIVNIVYYIIKYSN